MIEVKTEKVFVVGPYYPNNTYIVQRQINIGDIESKIKVCSRENKKKATLFATGLCERRDIPFGGYKVAGFLETEPYR